MHIINPHRFGETFPVENIISEYKYEDDVTDTVGSNNGTATSITYGTGGVGKHGIFNGTSSYVSVADSSTLSFTDGSDLPFSISFMFNFNTASSCMFVTKRNSSYTEYQCAWETASGGRLVFDIMSGGGTANYKREYYPSFSPTLGQWYHVVMTYAGSGRQEIYLDGVLQSTTQYLQGTYTGMSDTTAWVVQGRGGWGAYYYLDGDLDVVRFWDKELSADEVSAIATAELAGTDINP